MTEPLRVKILTTLNSRPSKRKRDETNDWHAIARSAVKLQAAAPTPTVALPEATQDDSDAFKSHFAAETLLLSDAATRAVAEERWTTTPRAHPQLGDVVDIVPEDCAATTSSGAVHTKQLDRLKQHMRRSSRGMCDGTDTASDVSGSITPLQTAVLEVVSTYRDLLHSRVTLDDQAEIRAALAAHAMSHVAQTRARVLKNNERAANAADVAPSETRDQGFTRPKVLVLLPLRNSALSWVRLLSSLAAVEQVENFERFERDFSLPPDTVDKLADDVSEGARYPRDHAVTFQGNIDDSFRVGLKLTRKALKLYSEFYGSDVIVASPLGLRLAIEEKDDDTGADFLSSIEIVIADQLDVMLMQNWEHVEFVFDRLNPKPSDMHGTDISRIKPWYLEGQAALLRQTCLLASHDSPEIRALFARSCRNVAGKVRTEPSAADLGVLGEVRRGVRQAFVRFDLDESASVASEDERRFEHFTTKTLPSLVKSAVSSSNTLILVPSYFDFVRLKAHMNALSDFSFAAVSEYSSNADVSRARSHFVSGKAAFLVITERLHFFRRYRLKGAKTVVFYGPPDHAHFYSELLSFPFIDAATAPDESEVSAEVVFSRLDAMRLRRVVGAADSERLCTEEGATRFTFV